jgi:dTDP-4-dehydrorhamnose 3,5-epimerase
LIFHELPLVGAYLVELTPHKDDRGSFARMWCREEFAKQGLATDFVQGNASINPDAGTLRGMHYQESPHGEVKLVRCLRGAIYDVIVDLRADSPSYLDWIGVELSPAKLEMLYVPEGFGHGFVTLKPDSEVNYLVSAAYAPGAGRGVRYDDPALGIKWPITVARISGQDQGWPLLSETAPKPRSRKDDLVSS